LRVAADDGGTRRTILRRGTRRWGRTTARISSDEIVLRLFDLASHRHTTNSRVYRAGRRGTGGRCCFRFRRGTSNNIPTVHWAFFRRDRASGTGTVLWAFSRRARANGTGTVLWAFSRRDRANGTGTWSRRDACPDRHDLRGRRWKRRGRPRCWQRLRGGFWLLFFFLARLVLIVVGDGEVGKTHFSALAASYSALTRGCIIFCFGIF